MEKKVVVFLFTIIIMISNQVKSQTTFEYNYDGNGNRIERNILSLKSATTDDDEDNPPGIDKNGKSKGEDVLDGIKLTVFPNPTQNIVNINFDFAPMDSKILSEVYDANGHLISKNSYINKTFLIDFTNQPSGTYIIRLKINSDVSEWKIIKE